MAAGAGLDDAGQMRIAGAGLAMLVWTQLLKEEEELEVSSLIDVSAPGEDLLSWVLRMSFKIKFVNNRRGCCGT